MRRGLTYTIENNRLMMVGDLTINNLCLEMMKTWKRTIIKAKNFVNIDCININKIDSSGIAWLLLSIKSCTDRKKQCHIFNFPDNMNDLIELYLTPTQRRLFHNAKKYH